MVKSAKFVVHSAVFLRQLKKVSETDLLAISARIAIVILRIVGHIYQNKICLFGLSIGCEINKVFLKYQRLVVIAKGL